MPNGPANGCPRSRSGKRPRVASTAAGSRGVRSSRFNAAIRRRAGARARPRWASTQGWGGRLMVRRIWRATSGNGRAACGRRKNNTVCFGAALGATVVSSPPARLATAVTRTTATSSWGFVAPGHSVTLCPFPCYPIFSLNCTLWVQGAALPKIFGDRRAACRSRRTYCREPTTSSSGSCRRSRNFRETKFLFGDRLVEIQFDLLENLIEAYYQKEKIANLRAANIGVEKLRHLLQISAEMRLLSFDQLEYATRSLNQIGSMIGGKLLKTGRAA